MFVPVAPRNSTVWCVPGGDSGRMPPMTTSWVIDSTWRSDVFSPPGTSVHDFWINGFQPEATGASGVGSSLPPHAAHARKATVTALIAAQRITCAQRVYGVNSSHDRPVHRTHPERAQGLGSPRRARVAVHRAPRGP